MKYAQQISVTGLLRQTCQFHQVATSLLKSGLLQLVICRLVIQLVAANLWITSFDNQLLPSLLTTCNKLVVNKLSQAMRTHPDNCSTEYPNCKFFSSNFNSLNSEECRWMLSATQNFDLSRLTFCLPLIFNLL